MWKCYRLRISSSASIGYTARRLISDQDTLQRLIPQTALQVYEQTDHSLQWEQPERFVVDLERFLQARGG